VIYQARMGIAGHRAISSCRCRYTEEGGLLSTTGGRPQPLPHAPALPPVRQGKTGHLRASAPSWNAKLPFDSLAALRKALVADVAASGGISIRSRKTTEAGCRRYVGRQSVRPAICRFF